MGRKRKGIVLLNEHMLFAQEVLSPYERAELYDAIRAYSMEGEWPDLSVKRVEWKGIFRIMSGAQDDVIRKYDETCERNRSIANNRWKAMRASVGAEHAMDTKSTLGTKQNETKQEETNQNSFGDDLSGREVKGVPGVVWA